MASTFGNWSMPYWNGLASAERSAEQLYRDWIRGQQLTSKNSPLSQVQKLTSSDLSGLSNNPYYLSSQEGSNASYGDSPTSPNAGPAPGAVAGALGALSNMAGQMAGMNSTLAGTLGGAVSGQASGRGALNGIANFGISAALNAVVPGLGLAVGLFGNPMDSILNSFDLPGMMDFGSPLGQMQSKSAMNALDQETSAIAEQAAQAHAVNEAYGGWGGLSDAIDSMGPLGDAPAAGGWGGDPAAGGTGVGGSSGQTGEAGSGTTGSAAGTGAGGGVGDGLGGDGVKRGGLIRYRDFNVKC